MHTEIIIRPMPEGYAADCWIVTGPIHSSEVKYYRHLKDAKAYAKELIREFKLSGWIPRSITIEQRQSDSVQRLPVLESFNKSKG